MQQRILKNMATINYDSIHQQIAKSSTLQNLAKKEGLIVFRDAKNELIQDINNHPVTKEIEEGRANPETATSASLGGKGNLWGFLGFSKGSNPIDKLKGLINEKTRFFTSPTTIVAKDKIKFTFKVESPELKDLEDETPYDEWSSRSWLNGIEKGIQGLERFAYFIFSNSRSGGGIQSRKQLRSSQYNGQPYITPILNKFRDKLKNK